MSVKPKIVVLNPNSTQAVTDALDAGLERLRFDDGPEIVTETLVEGPPGIETDQQVREVEEPLCRHLGRHERGSADGAHSGAHVIACFSDPGIDRARRELGRPVFGMAECGYLAACARAERFGVLSILAESIPRHIRYVDRLGLSERLAADLPIDLGVLELADEGRTYERLCEVGTELRDTHGAGALVLGCAGMVAHRGRLETELKVPVIECVQAAVSMAIGTVQAA